MKSELSHLDSQSLVRKIDSAVCGNAGRSERVAPTQLASPEHERVKQLSTLKEPAGSESRTVAAIGRDSRAC
jgi:hypothetical protein